MERLPNITAIKYEICTSNIWYVKKIVLNLRYGTYRASQRCETGRSFFYPHMKTQYQKEPTSVSEQIDLLESKGMDISDRANAYHILSMIVTDLADMLIHSGMSQTTVVLLRGQALTKCMVSMSLIGH